MPPPMRRRRRDVEGRRGGPQRRTRCSINSTSSSRPASPSLHLRSSMSGSLRRAVVVTAPSVGGRTTPQTFIKSVGSSARPAAVAGPPRRLSTYEGRWGRSLFVVLSASGLLATPAGSGPIGPAKPHGERALAVHGHGEWAAVAGARSGAIRKRRFSGGTLCHGPLLVVGARVVFSGFRGRGRPVARALPLSLRGPARSLGPADSFAASPSGHRVVLGRGLPRWSTLEAVTNEGLVITHGRWLTLWGPTRAARAAAHPRCLVRGRREAAVRLVSRALSRLPVVERPRRAADVPGPRGAPPRSARPAGTFSLYGRRLVAAVTVGGRTRVALVDLRGGDWKLVPGGKLGGYDAIAWSPSGRWLYFTASDEGLRAVAVGRGRSGEAAHAVPAARSCRSRPRAAERRFAGLVWL